MLMCMLRERDKKHIRGLRRVETLIIILLRNHNLGLYKYFFPLVNIQFLLKSQYKFDLIGELRIIIRHFEYA